MLKTISVFIIFSSIILQGQVKWDAGAGTDQWSDAANWVGNNVPATTDSVVLDNSLTSGSYTVTLPSGNTNTQVARIRITPDPGNTINFVLPSTNTSTNQALLLGDGTGNSYDFILNSGAIFKYQSGAASGTPFALVNSSDSILIYDGAKWYHNTKVGQTGIANKLAKRVAGTDHGVFEYDMPIFSSSIQFQNITYGTVKLSGASYGGLKRYITTGSSVTTIRGDFIIDANCYDSTVQTNRINIAGNLECNGYFKYAPVATPRWYTFNGKSEQTISGTGSIDLLGGMTVSSGSTLKVLNNFSLSNFNGNGTGKGVTIDGTLDLGSNVISGPCTLTVSSTGKLKLGLAPGLTSTPSSSNIQVTGTRTFNNTQWEFNGSTAQVTGDAFPASVDTLIINNSSGVTLSSALTINKGLQLNSGLLKPDYKTLSFGTLASVSGSPSSNSFISIDSSETIRKLFASTGSFTFPVGDNFGTSEYSPVTINFTSATFDPGAYVDVKLYNFKHPLNPSSTDYLSRYWRVSSSGISSFSCNASFTYNAADINGTEGNLNWGSLSGSSWTPLTGSLSGKQYAATITGFSDFTAGEASYFSGATFMNLSLLPSALYDETLNKLNMRDTVKLYLAGSISPYSYIDSATGIIDSLTFTSNLTFSKAPSGTYYLVVKHRNSIETWSKAGGESMVKGNTYSYDFSNDSSKAYGNNLVKKGTKWCLYSGDVNQDGFVDFSDMTLIDNDAYNFTSGYAQTDLNGDNYVDFTDLTICDNNAYNFVGTIKP